MLLAFSIDHGIVISSASGTAKMFMLRVLLQVPLVMGATNGTNPSRH
jgi:hypothetical protein